MAARPPRLEDIGEEFAIFPLAGALLLPHGKLPLNIFEPRYLAMVEDSLAGGRMFGMIQPDTHLQHSAFGPGLFRIGCLGRVSSFSEAEDGRFLITLTGLIRFSVVEELAMCRGYRRVRASCAGFAADLDAVQPVSTVSRTELLRALRAYFARLGIDANWDAINQMRDDMLVITLCMICPFKPMEKQALLESRTPADRAAALLVLLEMAAKGPQDGGQNDGASGPLMN